MNTAIITLTTVAGLIASANAALVSGVGDGKGTSWADMGITATTTDASYQLTGVSGSVDGEAFTYTITIAAIGNSTALSLNSAGNSIENVGANAKFDLGDGFSVTISAIDNANVVFDGFTALNVNNAGTTEGLTVDTIHYGAGDHNLTGAPLSAFEAIATQTNVTATAASVNSKGVDFQFSSVPEPSSAALLGLGGLALILRRRK